MMIMNTMTMTNKKRTKRSSVSAHRSSTRCWPRRSIVTRLKGSQDQRGQQIEHAEADGGLARWRGNQRITLTEGLNYIIDRRIIYFRPSVRASGELLR